MKKINKILIANRGEIALRIMRTCELLGIETVSIYTQKEENLPHRYQSTQSYCLGDGTLAQTYLNQDLLIQIAKDHKAQAIHPGYGFLSENAQFAKKVRKAGLIFIGPSDDAITLMGSKIESKKKAKELAVPVIPGYHGEKQDLKTLEEQASKIGFPLLIKASAGGGGKGMRVVHGPKEFKDSLEAAKREAQNAFGDDQVLLEKYLENPRHIEVQVFGDSKGHVIHLFERECSIQRRHQKIIEESPSPALSEKERKSICESAVKLAKGIGYEGAGTVEFIYEKGEFYFLEMNTRLQVEHPVTEMITGLDLVQMQIQVAQGEALSYKQEDITKRGHALEVRLYAEDPDNDFLPTSGKILKVASSSLSGARLDCGYSDDNTIVMDFDPMLAKLIVWGKDRSDAISQMQKCLEEVPFLGVTTNRDYLLRVLKLKDFEAGKLNTHFVEQHRKSLKPPKISDEAMAIAVALRHLTFTGQTRKGQSSQKSAGPWELLQSFRNC